MITFQFVAIQLFGINNNNNSLTGILCLNFFYKAFLFILIMLTRRITTNKKDIEIELEIRIYIDKNIQSNTISNLKEISENNDLSYNN